MNIKKLYFFLIVALLSTFTSCSSINNAIGFINCEYELGGLSNPAVAGVQLSSVTSIDQINALNMVKLAASIAQGSLPLSATVNVKATNPGAAMAQIEKLEWAIDLDNKEILQGVVDQRISVPANGGNTLIPFTLQLDLFKLIKEGSQNDLLNLALNFANAGDSNSKVGIRVKPTVMIGNTPMSLGFITVNKTIKSN